VGNAIGKVFTIFLAILLLFIYPLMEMLQQQNFTTHLFVYAETTKLVDAVRNTGYMTPRMYQEYTEKLSATDLLYEITLEHQHRKYDPIYLDPLDETTFQDDFAINYRGYYTQDILEVLFPSDDGESDEYRFSQGDYFKVKVVNKSKTLATKLTQLIYCRELPTEAIVIQYGGMIK